MRREKEGAIGVSLESKRGGGRWFAAVAVALAVVAAAVVLFRFPASPPQPGPSPKKSSVQLARPGVADEVLKQEAELRDLRPLFLPTNRNAALPEPKREPGRTILDEEPPKWSFGEADLQVGREFPPVATLGGKSVEKAELADALSIEAAEAPLMGFGRRGAEISPLLGRGGFVEVVAVRDGRQVLAELLPVGAGPPGGKAWAPMELLATVDAAGLTCPLVVTEGSRVEEADIYFRNYLAETFRIGARLPPGYYRITVAP